MLPPLQLGPARVVQDEGDTTVEANARALPQLKAKERIPVQKVVEED